MCQSAHFIHLTQFFKIKGEFLMKISIVTFWLWPVLLPLPLL